MSFRRKPESSLFRISNFVLRISPLEGHDPSSPFCHAFLRMEAPGFMPGVIFSVIPAKAGIQIIGWFCLNLRILHAIVYLNLHLRFLGWISNSFPHAGYSENHK